MAPETSALPDVYSSAFFQLEIDGTKVGTIRNLDGGGIKADVLTYQHGERGDTWRQLGRTKYEEFKITSGLIAGNELWKWIELCIKGTPERRNGALCAGDYEYKEKARREFTDGLIAEVQFPKFDAHDKNAANVVVTVSPEKMTYAKGSGAQMAPADHAAEKQKSVSACNFTFVVQGFENACKRVNKVDGFGVKCKIIEHQVSTRIENVKVPGKIELPNIAFYLPEVDAEQFLDHHTKSTMGGKRGAPIPSATLNFHNNARSQRGSFTFKDCTIFAVTHDKQDATTEDIRMVKVEMAIEGIDFKLAG
ncbi:MAG TPA: phage tail protein [Kofleriaceae bacterium]|nr:phage tail protein [Kofleriaceae bacterium]